MNQPPYPSGYPTPGQQPHRQPGQGPWQQRQPGQQVHPGQQWQPGMPGQQAAPQWQQGMPPGPPNMPPNMPPNTPGKKRSRGPIIGIVLVALLVLGAGGFWFMTGDSGDGGGTDKNYDAAVESVGAAEVSWQAPQGPSPSAQPVEYYWVTDSHLVRRLPGRVVAYDLKSGDEAWTYEIEGPPKDNCPASRGVSNNRVALLVSTAESESDSDCGKLVVLDIAAGEEVFAKVIGTGEVITKEGRTGEPAPSTGDRPEVFGERVFIGGDAGRVLDIGTGEPASVPGGVSSCALIEFAVFGELLLAEVECGDVDLHDDTRLRAFDANLGQVWEWATPKGEKDEKLPVLGVLSVDPLVVEVGHLGHPSQVMAVDPKSGKTVPISAYDAGVHEGQFMTACDDAGLGVCPNGKVVDDKVIFTTKVEQINPGDKKAAEGQQSTEFRNELVAFDLKTGEEAWRTGQESGRMISMVRSDSGVVVFQAENPNGAKAVVFDVDPGTGKVSPLMPLGPEAHGNDSLKKHRRAFYFGGDNHQALYREGQFIMFSITHREDNVGKADTVSFTLE